MVRRSTLPARGADRAARSRRASTSHAPSATEASSAGGRTSPAKTGNGQSIAIASPAFVHAAGEGRSAGARVDSRWVRAPRARSSGNDGGAACWGGRSAARAAHRRERGDTGGVSRRRAAGDAGELPHVLGAAEPGPDVSVRRSVRRQQRVRGVRRQRGGGVPFRLSFRFLGGAVSPARVDRLRHLRAPEQREPSIAWATTTSTRSIQAQAPWPSRTLTRYTPLTVPAIEIAVGGEGVCARVSGRVYSSWGTNGVDSQGSQGHIAEDSLCGRGSLDTAVEIAAGFAFDCARPSSTDTSRAGETTRVISSVAGRVSWAWGVPRSKRRWLSTESAVRLGTSRVSREGISMRAP